MRGEYADDHQEQVVKQEHNETVKSDPVTQRVGLSPYSSQG